MEFSLAIAISFLFVGLSSSHIIPSHVQNGSEQNNSNNDTLIFAHVVSEIVIEHFLFWFECVFI